MSNVVFGFRFKRDRGFVEGIEVRRIDTDAKSSIEFTRNLDSTPRFIASGAIVLDGVKDDNEASGSETHRYNDWLTFYAARSYGADTFLYQAQNLAAHREVQAEALGTAAGGAGESFTLARKYINSDALIVMVAGVIQPAADYSLTSNNTAPQIDTNAGFDAGAVTADYTYRHKVKIANSVIVNAVLNHDKNLDDQGAVLIPVSLREYKAGDSLV